MNNFIDDIIEDDLKEGRVNSVVTRFPPEPNGYLHIGHAKSITLNFGLAAKYGGKCFLRFDDTNPAKEDEKYAEAIIKDVEWLGFSGEIKYGSDYFEIMYQKAELLINNGKAYVDDLTPEQMKESRGTLTERGKDSPNRNRPLTENLRLFREMKAGKHPDGSYTLRAKIDMNSPNINMRDPILYRVLREKHYRSGGSWCIYPMYDFAHPIQDAIEGITHSICTLEFEDHRPLYDWVITQCGFSPAPHQYEFARLNLTRTIMSKRYLKKLVDEGAVDGWDDPRMPTISGIRRRGYPASAVLDFCERIGVAKSNSLVDYKLLEHCVRDNLNATAKRVMAVLEPVKLSLCNLSAPEAVKVENNPNDETAGTRTLTLGKTLYIEREDFKLSPPPKYHRLTLGGMVRLKGAYIIRADDAVTDKDGNVIEIIASIIPGTKSGEDESGIKVKGVIHWVDAESAVDAEVANFDSLLLEGEGDFSERLNPDSKKTFAAKLESSLKDAKPGERFQFMRQGYYCRDTGNKNTFNQIVGLKDSFKA